MAQQTNPWKRQMMNNKANAPSAPTPSNPPQLNNPWKQKVAEQSTGSSFKPVSSPPPWKKPDNPSPNESPGQGNSSWKAGGTTGATGTGVLANNPWAKGKIDKQKQAKEAKEKQEQEKLQKQEQERVRKEEEERVRKQEEEKERLREEEERIKKQKQNELRENQQMAIQEELSKEFERQQIQKQKQRKSKTKQVSKDKIKRQKQIKKVVKQPKTKSPSKRNIQSSERIPIEDQSLSFKYYQQFQQIDSDYSSYNQKLQSQKKLILTYHEFQSAYITKIKQIIDSHEIPAIISIPESNTTLKFIKSTSTRESNSKQANIIYDESKLNQAKKLMYFSNLVNNAIIDGLRKRGDIRLRLGLISLLEYRGVMCLIKSQSVQENDSVMVDADKKPEVVKKLNILLKQINAFTDTGLKVEHFATKTIINADEVETHIIYLKQASLQSLNPPINQLKTFELIKNLNWADNLDKIVDYLTTVNPSTVTKPQSDLLQIITLSKKIAQIYRSGHGQIEDNDFLGIVVRFDSNLISILNDSGVKEVNQPICKGLFLQLIQKLTGLELEYDEDAFQTGNIVVKEANVIQTGYTFDSLEYVDVSKKYLILFQQGKLQLAEQSFEFKQNLVEIKDNKEQKVKTSLQKAEFLYLQNKYNESLEQLIQLTDKIQPNSILYVQKLILLIKVYSGLDRETELLTTFNEILSKLQFIFGQQTHYNSYLYCLLAMHYLKRQDKINEVIGLYQLALSIDKRVFGENSLESGEINLAIAQVYINHNKLIEAKEAIESANRIYQSNESKTGKIECVIMLAELAFLEGDYKLGQDNLIKALKYYQKIGKVNEIEKVLLLRLKRLRDNDEKEKVIQQLFELGNSYGKEKIIKKALELALRQQLFTISKSNIEKLLALLQPQDDQIEQIQLNFLPNLNKSLKTYPSINQVIREQISTFLKTQKPQSLISQIKSYLRQQKFIQIINSFSSTQTLS